MKLLVVLPELVTPQLEITWDSSCCNTHNRHKSLLWPGASQWRIYYRRKWGQLSTTCSNALKQPTGELLVAVNHNQLQTMASETVDPIDWSHPPPSGAVPPECLVHSINQCTSAESNVQPQHARQPPCLCGHSGYNYITTLFLCAVPQSS